MLCPRSCTHKNSNLSKYHLILLAPAQGNQGAPTASRYTFYSARAPQRPQHLLQPTSVAPRPPLSDTGLTHPYAAQQVCFHAFRCTKTTNQHHHPPRALASRALRANTAHSTLGRPRTHGHTHQPPTPPQPYSKPTTCSIYRARQPLLVTSDAPLARALSGTLSSTWAQHLPQQPQPPGFPLSARLVGPDSGHCNRAPAGTYFSGLHRPTTVLLATTAHPPVGPCHAPTWCSKKNGPKIAAPAARATALAPNTVQIHRVRYNK